MYWTHSSNGSVAKVKMISRDPDSVTGSLIMCPNNIINDRMHLLKSLKLQVNEVLCRLLILLNLNIVFCLT